VLLGLSKVLLLMTIHRQFASHWIHSLRLLAGLSLALFASMASADSDRWLLVDTEALTLTVMQGDWPQLTLHNLAIGRYGTSETRRRGDHTTPLGRFRISGIDRDAAFHRFLQLDYPDVGRADQAHREGVISDAEHRAILIAHRRGATPPQGTALGGQIGIHGLGPADPDLHRAMNWTRGCIALTDEQVDTLLNWVHLGMRVEVR